ncbi:MAG: hypothetical protein ACO23H_21030, partial [Alphaproteobacteria bacterium]
TLVVDSANNRVGIGTSSPGYSLQVQETSPIVAVQSSGANTSRLLLSAEDDAVYIGTTYGGSNIPMIFSRGGTSSGTESMRIDANGNVGIGTMLPSSELEVVGVVTIGEDTRTQKDTFVSSSYANDATSGGTAGSTTIQSGHSFDSGISFDLSGGDLNLYSGYAVSNRNGPGEARTFNGGNINIFAGNTDSANNTGNTMIDGAIRFGKRIADLTNTVTLSEYGRWDANGNLLVGRTGASGLGILNVEGGADFTGGDVLLCRDTGNVGIGTTSPSAPLTVQGGTASAATIQLKGGVNGNDNASIHSLYSLKLKADSSEAIAGREISFAVGATDAMTIDSSGNV